MGWRLDEVWLDTDVLWFREQPRKPFAGIGLAVPAVATEGLEPALFLPVATGLEASRRRRLAWEAARRRRLATRTVPAVALVLGSATMLPIYAFRQGSGGHDAGPLQADPPSLTFRLDGARLEAAEGRAREKGASSQNPAARTLARASEFAKIEWHRATSVGLPYSGRLIDGTQLPVEGPNWVTWNPTTDSVPNSPNRLYGNDHTIRTILSVLAAYRDTHPDAPRVVVGDISFRDGGSMDEHVSHENGLDVDVYYPRRDGHVSAPVATSQIDHHLAQDLLDRFVAAGAQVVFVGYSTGLRGPSGVVVPYPNHENHMHVRFPPPPG
jgi:murein endopeptidase